MQYDSRIISIESTLIRRHLQGKLEEAFADTPVVLVAGARRASKSTLAMQVLEGRRDARSFTFDDKAISDAAAADPLGFVETDAPVTLIDEVQRVPGIALAIKQIVDRDQRLGRFRSAYG